MSDLEAQKFLRRSVIKYGDPLHNDHHLDIVFRAYIALGLERWRPQEVVQYHSWSEVRSNPSYGSDVLVFVDGGITSCDIDLGMAILVNDGGIVEHHISCGRFFKDGGIVDVPVEQRLLSASYGQLTE